MNGSFDPLMMYQLAQQALQGGGQAPQPPAPPGLATPRPAGDAISALMGNPLFGAGMGLLSSASGGGDPYQAALAGMLGTSVFKRQQQQYDLEAQKAKAEREQLKNITMLAQEGLKTIDVDGDGNISPAEQARAEYLKGAATTGDATLLAEANKTLQSLQPKPTSLQQNLRLAGLLEGTPEYQQAALAYVTKPQTQISMGEVNKPVGSDAINWVMEDGSRPNPLLTIEQIVAMRGKPVSPEERKSTESAKGLVPSVASMMNFGGIGTDRSLFSPDDANLVQRGIAGAEAAFRAKTVDPNSPELISYVTFRDATISNIARLVGQVGTLTDLDVDMVRQLWPRPGLTTDNVAAQQFRNIVGLLKAKGLTETDLIGMGIPKEYARVPAQSPTYSDLPGDK